MAGTWLGGRTIAGGERGWCRRRRSVCAAIITGALLALTTTPAHGQQQREDRLVTAAQELLGLECQQEEAYTGNSVDGSVTTCTGELATFDGITLQTVLTLPVGHRLVDGEQVPLTHDGRVPVVLFQSGWGGGAINFRNTEHPTFAPFWHWNNLWWARKGYATLSYSFRGFFGSCGSQDDDPTCAHGATRIADKAFEVRDGQHLLGTLVDAGIADPGRLAATGGSYGGGHSLMLATSLPWKTPEGRRIQLAAAVPWNAWSDLHDALLPNGRANTVGRARAQEPIGVLKESWVDLFWSFGRAAGQGRYSSSAGDWGANFDAILSTWQAGEPYGTTAREIEAAWRAKSPRYNTDYFSAVRAGTVKPVPILALQGWTDGVFPAEQVVSLYHALRTAKPDYPVSLAFGDFGHGTGERPEHYRAMSDVANTFLDAALAGGEVPREVRSLRTSCGEQSTQWTVAPSWDALPTQTQTLRSEDSAVTASHAGEPTQPLANGHLPCASDPAAAGVARWRWDVAEKTTLLGTPTVKVRYELTGTDATVAAKLWDVSVDGTRTLITRGVYRLSAPQYDAPSGALAFELFGNHWTVPAGHQIELEISQTDTPFLRQNNLPSSVRWSHVELALPLKD